MLAERFADAYHEAPLSITKSKERNLELLKFVQSFRDLTSNQSAEKYDLTNTFVGFELKKWR